MKEQRKVVKYHRPLHLNIGVVVFGIIFIYIIFNVYFYFTEEHVSVYEVVPGTIAENNTYTGLILREEKLVTSDYNGYVDYYLHDTAKAGVGNLVCSVDENGSIAQKLETAGTDDVEFDKEDYDGLKETITSFDSSFVLNSFYTVYSFKTALAAQLMETLNKNALETFDADVVSAQQNQSFHMMYADEPGIVVYDTDGYEGVTEDSFQPDMLDPKNYTRVNLKSDNNVQSGAPVYKLITSENWKIVLQIDAATQKRLADDNVVQIQFKKDGITCWVNYKLVQRDGVCYMILSLKDHMVRFANDRYIELELLLDEKTGLKIPNTAIVEKEFYKVPKEYFMKGGNSSAYGLMVQQTDDTGKTVTIFTETTLYYETEDTYYVKEDGITAGTVIQKPDSAATYTIRDTAKLSGVYNINKGYAVFKQIDILYQSEEYTVVRTGTDYGLSLYDHIALEGNTITEDTLIH